MPERFDRKSPSWRGHGQSQNGRNTIQKFLDSLGSLQMKALFVLMSLQLT